MRVNIKKDDLIKIETAFKIYKTTRELAALQPVKEALNNFFPDYKFADIAVIGYTDNDEKMFVMSVYPEVSTVNKIIDAVMSDKEITAIQKLWQSNKTWFIEIDGRIFDHSIIDLNEKELTALLLHEVGHIVASNSISTKVSTILKYEVTKAQYSTRVLFKTDIFKNILSLPIFDACVSDGKTSSSIKEEIKADSFVKKAGYSKELQSVLTKLIKNSKYPSKDSMNSKMKKVAVVTTQMLDDFQARRDRLAKKNFLHLKESINSPYFASVVSNIYENIFEDGENMYEGRKMEFAHEKADDAVATYEAFIFKNKGPSLPQMTELDYIDTKISQIQSETDKMMIISYINTKRDMCDYYISLASNPKYADKYRLRGSMKEASIIKARLDSALNRAIQYKIPNDFKVNYIQWPTGPARALYVPKVNYPTGYEG